ncbi:MAG: SGNH/GDSL hydrolase family protein [Acutalibacteraceae bacterium]|nr:SGNH/GDSL hydrolase family protein [Acutalibacteraceae bacterium]
MVKTADIDKNLKVSHALDPQVKACFDFYDIEEAPFDIRGVYRDGDNFIRLPREVADVTNEGVKGLNNHSAGGRIRFVTDSKRIALIAEMANGGGMPHIAYAGVSGFDLYGSFEGYMRYFGTFVPPLGYDGGYESVVNLPSAQERTININMPLYNCTKKVYIGIEKGSTLKAAEPLNTPPVVYYGSSITQGGCASRPGNCYQAIVHKDLKTDYINLGFSGSARAEDVMMDYIAGLDMSVFVYDYDHNAPNTEHLERTHYNGYKRVRDAHPDLPIILMSRPKYHLSEEEVVRREIINRTYQRAIAEGDKNIHFIRGDQLIPKEVAEAALVDNCHPTDIGFFYMAKALLPVIKEYIK